MVRIILLFLTLILSACANQGGGSSESGGSAGGGAIVESKACDSPISRIWSHDAHRVSYEFGRNCTGKIPTCDQVFSYKLNFTSSQYRGTMDLTIQAPNIPGNLCADPGTNTCTFFYDLHGTRKLTITCPGYSAVTFTPGSGVEY